ncbi:MAG: hypothetical protein QOG10_2683, partial [Kribbellaceae bacterium]|nr:hypothetical protein [Kribbellaceae bacterium]
MAAAGSPPAVAAAGVATVATNAMIEIRQVTKTYGVGETAVHALRGVSLNV